MTAHETIGEPHPVPAGAISYEEFLDWYSDTHAEWVRGEVQLTSPAALPHQSILSFLVMVLSFWVRARDLGRIIPAPFQMKLPQPENAGREADLIFVAREHFDR